MPAANGGATTANGSSGSGSRAASPSTTSTRDRRRTASRAVAAQPDQLDRAYSGACVGERACQRAAAGTEVEHERPGRDPGVPDELVGEGATTKSVATARPRLR